MEKKCEWCANKFVPILYNGYPDGHWKNRKYCSKKCAALAISDPNVEILCKGCQKSVIIKEFQLGIRKYCNKECYWKSKPGTPNFKNRGKKATPETIKKLSESHKGQPGYWKGRKLPPHVAEMKRGSNSHLWKGGITPVHTLIRKSYQYKLWRREVFERDNYTCQFCWVRGGRLNADHIKPFALYPELRFELSNGRTLCLECHKKTDTYGKNIRFIEQSN